MTFVFTQVQYDDIQTWLDNGPDPKEARGQVLHFARKQNNYKMSNARPGPKPIEGWRCMKSLACNSGDSEFKGGVSSAWKWVSKALSCFATTCIAVIISLCQINAVVAMESGSESAGIKKETAPSLGDPNYKLDYKYAPIYGSMDGKSFALHYCLPGFIPQVLGKCDPGSIPGRDPNGVQVHYAYSLVGREAEQARVEGSAAFKFPFPVNVSLEGKTPYFVQYKKNLKGRNGSLIK